MSPSPALFPALLGEQWHALAAPVRCLHGDAVRVRARGVAHVEGDTHARARWLRRLLGLPEPGPAQPVEVTIERDGSGETWTRRFARGHMQSHLARSTDGSHLCERLGPVTLHFALRRDGDSIDWQLRGGRLLGVPLPRAWLGTVRSRSGSQGGRYAFRIDTRLPLLGRLVAYRGWLEPVDG
jgi:Domain of unknown function (DUF4166)